MHIVSCLNHPEYKGVLCKLHSVWSFVSLFFYPESSCTEAEVDRAKDMSGEAA